VSTARTVTVLVLAATLAAPPIALADFAWPMRWEATETGRVGLDAAGQKNCVAEAMHGDPLAACPLEATGQAYPALGRRVLDDVYVAIGPQHPNKVFAWVDESRAAVESGSAPPYTRPLNLLLSGGNWRQDSEGEMPDVITPGGGMFSAMYGWWSDLDGDGVAEVVPGVNDPPTEENEWVSKPDAVVVSYIEPGSHPMVTNRATPGPDDPDITYLSVYYYSMGYPVIFADGSLLRPITVTTVADALLSPDDEGRPYTAGVLSRADIDRYVSMAPAPVGALYQTVAGDVADDYASPSLGLCPARCEPGPMPLGSTPLGGTLEPLLESAWARYPREWAAGSGSTSAGRHAAHLENYAPWIDLLPRTSNPLWLASLFPGPLVGRNVGEDQAAAPGSFALEAWIGLWKDHSADGFVGRPVADDPYEGGSRPLPDDYLASKGEFIGVFGRESGDPNAPDAFTLTATLTPDTDWGPGGVFVWASELPLGAVLLLNCRNFTEGCAVREGPIRMSLVFDSTTAGRYASWGSVFMPAGSPGFTVCTDTVWIRHAIGGEVVVEPVRDCDRIARYV